MRKLILVAAWLGLFGVASGASAGDLSVSLAPDPRVHLPLAHRRRQPPGREALASEARLEVAGPFLGIGNGRGRGWGPAGQVEAVEDRLGHFGRLDRSD